MSPSPGSSQVQLPPATIRPTLLTGSGKLDKQLGQRGGEEDGLVAVGEPGDDLLELLGEAHLKKPAGEGTRDMAVPVLALSAHPQGTLLPPSLASCVGTLPAPGAPRDPPVPR